ncbi:MAG: STAS domain-containing protein [Chthoniobacterales bacterium]|nr:STAS domain-containing protein [Chthoniobacterales bacterium]
MLPFLSQLGELRHAEEIALDFSHLRRVTPAGLTALAASVNGWQRQNRGVAFHGLSDCAITGYLQRMDLLSACRVQLPKGFQRHEAQGRFVPVRVIDHDVTQLGRDVAGCLAPGGEDYDHPMAGLYDLANYVITEVANNTRQHSAGVGYAAAQVTRTEGFVRIALADDGIGMLRSLQLVEYPGSDRFTDMEAICKSMEPRVSCKVGNPNEGVGLTLVSNLTRLAKGWLMIVSGSGVVTIPRDLQTIVRTLPDNGYYRGTLVAGSFPQQTTRDFADLLQRAKIGAGLLRGGTINATFEA